VWKSSEREWYVWYESVELEACETDAARRWYTFHQVGSGRGFIP
jgi:hypothetical protein